MRATHKKKDQQQHFVKLVQAVEKVISHTKKCAHTLSHSVYVCVTVYFDLCISNKNYSNEGADMRSRSCGIKQKCKN